MKLEGLMIITEKILSSHMRRIGIRYYKVQRNLFDVFEIKEHALIKVNVGWADIADYARLELYGSWHEWLV